MEIIFKRTCFLTALAAIIFMTGCANLSTGSGENLDERLSSALDNFCPIPKDKDTVENHSKRAHMVLAAITGYAYRSVQNYSKTSEASDDATRSISRINNAFVTLKATDAMQASGIYPIQRADMIIDLTEAAEVAISPTMRAGKTLVVGSVTDRLSLMKTAMIAFLEDKLYLEAYKKSCSDLSVLDIKEIDTRTKKRCDDLATAGRVHSNTCNIQP